jgi:hypothetical protein
MLYWQSVTETTNEIQNQAEVLRAVCYITQVNTLIPTLF